MSLHFHPLTVKEITRETEDCVSIVFDIPPAIRDKYLFKQGQNVAIKTHLDNTRRSFSICASPADNEFRIAVKKVTNGVFSTWVNEQLKVGDTLEVMPPSGTFFTEIHPQNKKKYVFFAAGSGITPIISNIKAVLQQEPGSRVTLVYGNKNMSSIIFKQELEALKDKHLERFRMYHILSREKTDSEFNYGRIDINKIHQLAKLIDFDKSDEFFICGPEEMIFTVRDFLIGWGIKKENIHFELFTTPTKTNIPVYETIESTSSKDCEVHIKVDGRSYELMLDYNSNTVLDAGLAEGIDLPFACKGGVCCSCKAKLIEGKVEMEANYGLEDSEVKDGYILTCQSHPRSPKIVVDYDQ